jgi:hypothetical protein
MPREVRYAYRTRLKQLDVPTVLLGIARRAAKVEMFMDGVIDPQFTEIDMKKLGAKYTKCQDKLKQWFNKIPVHRRMVCSSVLAKWAFLSALDDFHLMSKHGVCILNKREVEYYFG